MSFLDGSFTRQELRAAAKRLSTSVHMVVDKLGTEPFNVYALRQAARTSGYDLATLGMVIENARAHQAPLEDLRKLKVPVAKDDDVITARELKDALIMLQEHPEMTSWVRTENLAGKIMKHAADHREPEYSPGTVVRDSDGKLFKRTSGRGWLMFGMSHVFSHSTPLRPLEVI